MASSKSCRICQAGKEVVVDLKYSEFKHVYELIIGTKVVQKLFALTFSLSNQVVMFQVQGFTYTMICLKCYSTLENMHEFVNLCLSTHQIFQKREGPAVLFDDDDDEVVQEKIPVTTKRKGPPRTRELPANLKTWECHLCQRVFHRKDYLNDHVKTHTAQKLQCRLCNKWFKGDKCLNIHLRSKHNMFEYQRREYFEQNPIKGETAEQDTALEEQIKFEEKILTEQGYESEEIKKEEGEDEPEDEPMLEEEADDQTALGDVDAKPPIIIKKKSEALRSSRPIPCTKCDQIFTRKDSLQSHMRVKHFPRVFTCDICDKDFNDRRCILRHMKNIHLNEVVPSARKCYVCSLLFDTREELKAHKRKMHKGGTGIPSIDKVPCHVCGLLFNRKTIQLHVQSQ